MSPLELPILSSVNLLKLGIKALPVGAIQKASNIILAGK